MTLEKDIEDAFVAFVELLGGKCYKLKCDGRRGWPDRTVIMPNGLIVFVEFKKPGGKLSPNQVTTISILRGLGCNVMTGDSLDELKNTLLDFIEAR